MKFNKLAAFIFAGALLTGTGISNAAIVTYQFAGTVDTAGGLFLGGVGEAFSGTFSYDDTAATTGVGAFGGTAYSALSFIVDGTSLANPEISILENFGGNQFVEITSDPGDTPFTFLEVGSSGLGLFGSDALSELNNRTLADFGVTTPFLTTRNTVFGGILARGELTSFSQIQVVPLPAALPLFASGLGFLGFLGWRRRRKATADAVV